VNDRHEAVSERVADGGSVPGDQFAAGAPQRRRGLERECRYARHEQFVDDDPVEAQRGGGGEREADPVAAGCDPAVDAVARRVGVAE